MQTPELHNEAAFALQRVLSRRASVKSAVLSGNYENKKELYAVVCETLRYLEILNQIIKNTKLIKREKKNIGNRFLGLVLLYEYLVGKGFHKLPKHLKLAVLEHKDAIRADLARQKTLRGVTTIKELLVIREEQKVNLPWYVRVNTIKTTISDVCHHFKSEGFTEYSAEELTNEGYIELLDNLEADQFVKDLHVDNLLVFPQGIDLHDHVLYIRGDIILQDKASCIPAQVLAPLPGSHVIDCCAAPGNKTSHAAALMKNTGKIFAFDLDPKRLATMNSGLLKAGVLCVDSSNQDILTVDPTDSKYSKVEYIIVDPSCSGSGIVNRLGEITDNEQSSSMDRLENLAAFQTRVLLHALSFPAAKRVVYSTCSRHQEENESVVFKVLKKVHTQFHLTDALPEISSRGLKQYLNVADNCLRLSPMQDRTNGFFIACFERRGSDPPTRDRTVENRNKEVKKSDGRDRRVKPKGRMNNRTDTGLISNRGIDSKKTKNQKAKKSVEGNNRQPNNSIILERNTQKTENDVLSSKRKKTKKRKNIEIGASHREDGFEDVFKRAKLDVNEPSKMKKKKQNRRKKKHNKPVTM